MPLASNSEDEDEAPDFPVESSRTRWADNLNSEGDLAMESNDEDDADEDDEADPLKDETFDEAAWQALHDELAHHDGIIRACKGSRY